MLLVSSETADEILDDRDRRLFAALQCDGRVSARRAAEVLGLSPRTVGRRLAALTGSGTVRVLGVPPRPASMEAMLLRVRVLRGRMDAVAAALAARDDIPFIDISAGGDEIGAIALTDPASRNRLVLDQLPATSAVAAVTAVPVLHVFSEASDWRYDALSPAERAALTPVTATAPAGEPLDETDRRLLAALAPDARRPSAALAAATGLPESTVRRRLAALAERGALRTHAVIDPRRLGLATDANLWMQVPPGRLDTVGRALAAHPAVHGALATSGPANLQIAVWVRDRGHLYRFITEELAPFEVDALDTVVVGRAVKRPGTPVRIR